MYRFLVWVIGLGIDFLICNAGYALAEKIDSNEVVRIEETLKMEMYINQALIDLLVEKGLLTYDEVWRRLES